MINYNAGCVWMTSLCSINLQVMSLFCLSSSRRVLNLVQYLQLPEKNSDCSIVVSSAHVREAAVRCHLEFAGDRSFGGSTVLAEEDKLKEVLQRRIEGISG